MNSSARFWNRMASRYSKKPVPDEEIYNKKIEITQSYLRPDMNLLEFGCGTGSTALTHASLVNHILAIDFSEKMIGIAEAKRQSANIQNVDFERRTIEHLNAAEHSFDIVLGLSILHLLDSWEETIQKVYSLLKPGGCFISSTACIADSMKLFKFIAPIGRSIGLLPELAIFTRAELVQGFYSTGFSLEREWQPGKNQAIFIVAKKPK
jgi:2-polyprenyl-3-methyl-5-hydroxy-6-metoxy-1,4-benzoquinol methylase